MVATPGQLVGVLADVTEIPAQTVVVHDRNLVVAGLRSKKSRGRGAASVTALDAARLLTAVLASAQVKDSVPTVERYAATRAMLTVGGMKPFAGAGIKELEKLPPGHSFIDALAALIGSVAAGTLAKTIAGRLVGSATRSMVAPSIEVTVMGPGTVGEIRVAGAADGVAMTVRYALPSPWDKAGKGPLDRDELDAWAEKMKEQRGKGDIRRTIAVSEATILALAELLAPTKEDQK